MAKVPKDQAAAIKKAGESWGQFTVLEPGLYAATLEEVDASGEGPKGDMFWKWVFNYDNQPGKAFHNTSFADKAKGSVGAVFRAFDADVEEDDTDELIGEQCILSIGKGPVKSGPRKGEIRNYVNAVLPWIEGFVDEVGEPDPEGNGEAAPATGAAKRQRRKAAATGSEKAGDWD